MNHKIDTLIKKLKPTDYRGRFETVYKDGLNVDNLLDAIAAGIK